MDAQPPATGTIPESIQFSETDGRLKVVLPVRLNWPALALASAALIVWAIMIVVIVRFIFGGGSDNFVLTALLLLWLLVWLFFGRFLWRWWQFYAANREVLFVEPDRLVIRRPVSLLGETRTYDRGHVSPFYFSDRHRTPAFDYAYAHVYFGQTLAEQDARELVAALNARLFPGREANSAGSAS